MTAGYDCNIVASNNVDFVIADNIKSGSVPVLLKEVVNVLILMA